MGEEVKKLDMISNDNFITGMKEKKVVTTFITALVETEKVCAMVSEENGEVVYAPGNKGDFIACFDPLDGSSNIDVAVPVGSIFAIYKRKTSKCGTQPSMEEIFQQGQDMVCAGYTIFRCINI